MFEEIFLVILYILLGYCKIKKNNSKNKNETPINYSSTTILYSTTKMCILVLYTIKYIVAINSFKIFITDGLIENKSKILAQIKFL